MGNTSNTKRESARGFTLVEILIVVVILGILAAIIVPQFGSASTDARTTNIRTTLANVRNQIEIFKSQHNETAPSLAGMWALMTSMSDTTEANSATPTGTHLGPYLQTPPINPFNGQTAVSNAPTDANAGWYYEPAGLGFTFFARDVSGATIASY